MLLKRCICITVTSTYHWSNADWNTTEFICKRKKIHYESVVPDRSAQLWFYQDSACLYLALCLQPSTKKLKASAFRLERGQKQSGLTGWQVPGDLLHCDLVTRQVKVRCRCPLWHHKRSVFQCFWAFQLSELGNLQVLKGVGGESY